MALPTRVQRALTVDPFESFARDFDPLFRRFFDRGTDTLAAGLTPYAVDVYEDADHLHVEAELPGFSKENVDVTLDNNVLTITAVRDERTEQSQPQANGENAVTNGANGNGANGEQHVTNGRRAAGTEYLLRERRYARFQRSFQLPNTVNESSVNARLDNGVLHVTLDKKQELKPRKISVA